MQVMKETAERTLIDVDVRNLFGLKDVSRPVIWKAYDIRYDDVPEINENYVFEKLPLIELHTFMESTSVALEIIGHTGTGKSSFVEEYHARLNLPLYVINAAPRMTSDEMIGQFIPTKDGSLTYSLGALAKAAKEGCSLLIDEFNVLDPAEATALNALLEGRSVFVPELNDWIHPTQGFKVFATVNPKAPGYVGRNTQDAANDDRWTYMLKEYMSEEAEVALVKGLLTEVMSDQVAEVMAIKFRAVAHQVRTLFMSDSSDALEVTISTRSLLRWVEYFLMYQGLKDAPYHYEPIHFALERAKTLKASPTSRLAIHQHVSQVFGFEYVTATHPKT